MKIALVLFVFGAVLLGFLSARDIPQVKPDPSLEYELIDPAKPKPLPKSFAENPQSSNNKTFTYDPKSGTWTPLKPTDPIPDEGTLQWNQNNDKWLTQSFRP